MNTTIRKWGNSYAVRLPKNMVRKMNLEGGRGVTIRETKDGKAFSIVPVDNQSHTLGELASRITKSNRHMLGDWGSAIGKEVW